MPPLIEPGRRSFQGIRQEGVRPHGRASAPSLSARSTGKAGQLPILECGSRPGEQLRPALRSESGALTILRISGRARIGQSTATILGDVGGACQGWGENGWTLVCGAERWVIPVRGRMLATPLPAPGARCSESGFHLFVAPSSRAPLHNRHCTGEKRRL